MKIADDGVGAGRWQEHLRLRGMKVPGLLSESGEGDSGRKFKLQRSNVL